MFKKNIIFSLILSLVSFFVFSSKNIQAESIFTTPPEANSVSYSEGAFAPLLNPTFADLPASPHFAYQYLTYDYQDNGNHFFLVNLYGFSFNYTRYNYLPVENQTVLAKTDFFNLNKGFFYDNYFGFGLGFSGSKSEKSAYDDYRSWKLGFLYRPFHFLSLGLIFLKKKSVLSPHDLWSSFLNHSLYLEEIYSVSLRPFGDQLTFSWDGHRLEGENFSNLKHVFSSELKTEGEFSLFFKTDDDLNLKFGFSLPFNLGSNQSIFNIHRTKNKEDKSDFISFGLSLSKNSFFHDSPLDSKDNVLLIKFDEPLKENAQDGRSFFDDELLSFYHLLEAIKEAKASPEIKGILLRIDKVSYGFAQLQEIGEQLTQFKTSGKMVYALLTTNGNKEYYLASQADKIYLTPSSSFAISGLQAEVYFFKGLLKKIGVKFEAIKRGEYKSFDESFTREHMSDEFKENMQSLLEDLNQQYINGIKKGRKIDQATIDLIFRKGVITPKEAVAYNFVDRIGYQNELCQEEKLNPISLQDFVWQEERESRWGPLPQIAVVYLNGSIVRGKSSSYMNSMGEIKYCSVLETAFSNEKIKAVVIRVDSGGGSAVASDLMWHCLLKLKKDYDKPVIFSFGNMAASGGYYVACTGDEIFSSQGTIVGSIGVFSGKITAKELYEKIGISKDVIKMSEFADIFSESKELSERDKEVLQLGVNYIYDRFTGKVMEAREIKKEEISQVAEGRVFTGNQGLKNKLVNKNGGLLTAIEYAASKVKITERYQVVLLPDEISFSLDQFINLRPSLKMKYIRLLANGFKWLDLAEEKALYLYPYQIEIK